MSESGGVRHRSVKIVAGVLACALAGCAALFDFGDYDPSRPDVQPDASVLAEPFSIRAIPTSINGLSGDEIVVQVTIERRATFTEPISVGLGGAPGSSVAPLSIPGTAAGAEARIKLGAKHGSFAATLTATTPAYPSFTASTPLEIGVRGRPGTLDTSFAGTGVLDADALGSAEDVIVLADGRLLIAGTDRGGPASSGSFALARILADGTLDGSFGSAGHATVFPASGRGGEGAECLAQTADGRTVVGGTRAPVSAADGESETLLVRVDARGAADPTFGDAGVDLLQQASGCRSLHVLPDGKLLVVSDKAVERQTSGGARDASFGDAGRALDDNAATSFLGAVVAADSSSVVGGVFVKRDRFKNESTLSVLELSASGETDGGLLYPETRAANCDGARPLRLGGRVVIPATCATGKLGEFMGRRVSIAAVGDGGLDLGFGDAGVLTGPAVFESLAAVLAAGPGFVLVGQSSGAARSMVVSAHDLSGVQRWVADLSSSPLVNAIPRGAAVDLQGKPIVVGNRDVGGQKRAFVARFWP